MTSAGGAPTDVSTAKQVLVRLARSSSGRLLFLLVIVAPAIAHLCLISATMLARLRYPMDLEWLEGAFLYGGFRVLRGEPLYPPPSGGYLGLNHPPGWIGLLACIGRFTTLDYAPARCTAIACVTIAAAALAHQVSRARRSTEGVIAAVVCLGWIAAAYPWTGSVYDLARDDAFGVATLVGTAVLAASERPSRVRCIAAGIMAALAVYVRATNLFSVAWIVSFRMRSAPRIALLTAGTAMSVALAALALLVWSTGGWFWTYMVSLPAAHPVQIARMLPAAWIVLRFAPFLLLLPVMGGLLRARRRRLSFAGRYWLGLLAATIPGCLLPFAKEGGWMNDILPLLFLAAPVSLIVILDALDGLGRGVRNASRLRMTAVGALSFLLLFRFYDPRPMVPDTDQWKRAVELNETVARLPGGVLAPCHPFLAIRNGKRNEQLHVMPFLDFQLARVPVAAPERMLAAAQWLIVDNARNVFDEEIARLFRFDRIVGPVPALTGAPVGPVALLRRR